jgi:UPF0755 protein
MQSTGRYYVRVLIIIVLFFAGLLLYQNDPPNTFPSGVLITIRSGDTVNSITKDLKSEHIIRSTILLRSIVVLLAGEQKIVAGDYYFSRPISAYRIASTLVNGKFDLAPIRVTIPEGSSMEDIAALLSSKFTHFSTTDFMKYSPAKEGYLFPDTYLFPSNITTDEVIAALQRNFKEKTAAIEPTILAFGKPENEVITMASILEKEANNTLDWRIISGILWKRLEIGMPLQVDSTLGYLTDKTSSQLTTSDLKTNSPYNTYANKGLPPTPIANPGLKTILAAVTPTTTPYLYFLSDRNGVIHYAATFAEHIKNRQKYLK